MASTFVMSHDFAADPVSFWTDGVEPFIESSKPVKVGPSHFSYEVLETSSPRSFLRLKHSSPSNGTPVEDLCVWPLAVV